MATAKRSQSTKQKLDMLTVSKDMFVQKIKERISSGSDLFKTKINNTEHLERHIRDYRKWNDYNSELLKSVFNNEKNEYRYGYNMVRSVKVFSGNYNPEEELRDLKVEIRDKIAFLEQLIEKADLIKCDVEEPLKKDKDLPREKSTSIFIVHGHDIAIQQSVARVVEKLKLKPIILNEQPNAGRTIIEKFESHSDVGFAIVLLTADDEGKAVKETSLQMRARQNVILELGYFIGKLGRKNVLPLYTNGVEIPNDIHGLLYVQLDGSGHWRFEIAKELREAGYSIDLNDLI